jgi:hypothetical protein
MDQPKGKIHRPLKNEIETARRGFIKRIAAILGGIGLSRSALVAIAYGTAAQAPAKPYLKPTYLPKGYVENESYKDRKDGFGGGPTETAVFYRNPQQDYHNPLILFVSPNPQRRFFSTDHKQGTIVLFTMASGLTITAQYYDGMWTRSPNDDGELLLPSGDQLHWDTSNVHALVFRVGDLTVGLRASRLAGVNLEELIRVASSLK